ncbi:MAG: SufD family Fe-S cluster assembly protein [Bacteriovoracales bacterium]|nr:SufD family Fe-S cluster assembly protein [Bacteriovoracales bacterium]
MNDGDALEALLAPYKALGQTGPDSLHALRSLGAKGFADKGLPGRKDEAWKYTSLKGLTGSYAWKSEGERFPGTPPVDLLDQRIVFYNGHWDKTLSTLGPGYRFFPLKEERDFDPLTRQLQGEDCFTDLALTYCREAYRLEIEERGERPLGIYHFMDKNFEGTMAHPLLIVHAREKSKAHLFEFTSSTEDLGSALYNAHTLITLGQGAHLDHVRIFKSRKGLMPFSKVLAQIHKEARYGNAALALGGSFLRNDLRVELLGEGAHVSLGGLYVHDTNEDSSHVSLIDHKAPKTSSRQLYKGLLNHHSHAFFQGTIVVGKDQADIESSQLNNNILLSDTARVDSRPVLEIGHCDVKCTHGTTIGQMDGEQLFYLRSRGFDESKAKRFLARGFCEETLFPIENESLHRLSADYLERSILEKIGDGEEGP